MARFAYFADLADGTVLEWRDLHSWTHDARGFLRSKVTPARVGERDGKLCGYDEARGWVAITRRVEMKASPSRHECDARCLNATGRTMKCECACGGKNHGRGAFVCA